MITFLLTVTRQGLIRDVHWSVPVDLVTLQDGCLQDLLVPGDRPRVLGLLGRPELARDILECEAQVRLIRSPHTVHICAMAMGEQVLLYGEGSLEEGEVPARVLSETARRFMQTLRHYASENALAGGRSARMLFEEIQSLNSELINTRRQLEQANARLKMANLDLNNRLVKDALTGLVSRYQYRSEMELMIRENPGRAGVFAFVDLDDFKRINDTYGHGAGDLYLQEVANRLRLLPLTTLIPMRIAGDEFGLFTMDPDVTQEPGLLWEKLDHEIRRNPVQLEEAEESIGISVGMALYGIHTRDIFELIEYADYAMYQAKRAGKGAWRLFDPEHYRLEKLKPSTGKGHQ